MELDELSCAGGVFTMVAIISPLLTPDYRGYMSELGKISKSCMRVGVMCCRNDIYMGGRV